MKLRLENMDTGVRVKENIIKYRERFLEKSCKDLHTTKIKKLSHLRKMRVTQRILDRKENRMLKRYGYVVRMEKTWPKRIWSGHRQAGNDEDDPKCRSQEGY